MTGESLVEVQLQDFPVDLWRRTSAHQEAIQRELEIMRASEPEDSVPNRTLSLLEVLEARFGGIGDPTWETVRTADERGEPTIDLNFRVPPSVADAASTLASMLAEVDEYCRSGDHLMTLATPDDLVAFRTWFLEEFSRQIEGEELPLSWHEYISGRHTSAESNEPSAAVGRGSATIMFAGSLDLDTAGELRDAIQERRAQGLLEIVIDLTNVGFVDSIGIGLLVTTYSRLQDEGVNLRLVVPPRLKELLRLSGLLDLLRPEVSPAP